MAGLKLHNFGQSARNPVMSEIKKQSVNSKGGARKGAGRPKGSLDKGNALLRDMLADAVHSVGGASYFAELARSHPTAFAALVGRLLPLQVTGEDGEAIKHSIRVSFG
jgi:hypothetical protein